MDKLEYELESQIDNLVWDKKDLERQKRQLCSAILNAAILYPAKSRVLYQQLVSATALCYGRNVANVVVRGCKNNPKDDTLRKEQKEKR